MTLIGNVTLQFSDSGKICRILSSNGRIIAEMYVHGPLVVCALNAMNNKEIVKGRPNIYRGELDFLDKNEFLNTRNECIEERIEEVASLPQEAIDKINE